MAVTQQYDSPSDRDNKREINCVTAFGLARCVSRRTRSALDMSPVDTSSAVRDVTPASDVLRHDGSALGGSRTHTVTILSRLSLPIGIRGPKPDQCSRDVGSTRS